MASVMAQGTAPSLREEAKIIRAVSLEGGRDSARCTWEVLKSLHAVVRPKKGGRNLIQRPGRFSDETKGRK